MRPGRCLNGLGGKNDKITESLGLEEVQHMLPPSSQSGAQPAPHHWAQARLALCSGTVHEFPRLPWSTEGSQALLGIDVSHFLWLPGFLLMESQWSPLDVTDSRSRIVLCGFKGSLKSEII